MFGSKNEHLLLLRTERLGSGRASLNLKDRSLAVKKIDCCFQQIDFDRAVAIGYQPLAPPRDIPSST
jgi:hypothetical protein